MSWPRPIRIVGIGSPHGDDAVAWEVVDRLRRAVNEADVELHRLDGGQRLLDVLDGQGSLVLIDALEPANEPGRIMTFEWPDSRLAQLRTGSTHDMRPNQALQLAETLKLLPAKVRIYGIEAKEVAIDMHLSSQAFDAVRKLVAQLADAISS